MTPQQTDLQTGMQHAYGLFVRLGHQLTFAWHAFNIPAASFVKTPPPCSLELLVQQ